MKIFDEMKFSGTPEAIKQFIIRLEEFPQIGPWKRDLEAERSHAMNFQLQDTTRCFRTGGRENTVDVMLWLFADHKNAGRWRVGNVVPAAQNASLGEVKYHALLTLFRESVLPLARQCNIEISVPKLDVGPEYWLKPEQAELLRFFSEHANRSTGAAHPQDRERWNQFVIAVHRDGGRLAGADLKRILVEHDQWPEKMAFELACDLDSQLNLLRDFAKSA